MGNKFIKNNSIRFKLIIGIFIGCLIPYILGGLYLKSFVEKGLFDQSVEQAVSTLNQVNLLIERSLLSDMTEELTMLTSLDHVIKAEEGINSYIDFESNGFEYKTYENEKANATYFNKLKESHPSTNFIFIGTENGGYIEYPQFAPSKNYDPRLRPWYINTISQEGVVISDPYLTKETQDLVVSFTKPIVKDNQKIGVVGISVKIEDLTETIDNIKIGESGYIMVVNANNKIIVSPQNPEWILKSADETDALFLNHIYEKNGETFEAELNGSTKVICVSVSNESGWTLVSIIDKNQIIDNSQDVTGILIGIYIITLLLMFIILYNISSRITEPILSISNVINKMAKFDFTFYQDSKMPTYIRKNDEIGIIASALSEMHDNFVELIDQVETIDQEIKRIDLEQNELIKLELSEHNPFSSVSTSMNTLLERVFTYFNQLRESNYEVLEKNELLTASEEELKAQLSEIEEQREFINFLAYHDPLTNLPNRRKFTETLNLRINQEKQGAVVLLDLDNFKGINDTLGHVFGDRVLQAISARLNERADDSFFISRFGGDEFLILIDHTDDRTVVEFKIHQILELFDNKFQVDDQSIEINFSMGVSLFPKDSTDVNQLVMNADLALYSVKNSGKNNYKFYDESMIAQLLNKSSIELIMKDAIENDGFKLVYQPQINMITGKVYCYEALLRLKNYDISPTEFIAIAEENDSIIKIGRIVTEKVILQIGEWQRLGLPVKPVSINYSANQLNDTKYIDFVLELLEQHHVAPALIELEITENIFLENKEATLTFLNTMRGLGIKIAIDDFGTGYSSLSYLTFLPVDKIKLDKSLNDRFLELDNIKVMDSLIALSHSLNLEVVAEGIEELEQVKRLAIGKCDFIQGYYFSKPLEVMAVAETFDRIYYEPKVL